ncbi:MAG TPA: O-methyltransferase [Ktedonobacteraceae bacterium]
MNSALPGHEQLQEEARLRTSIYHELEMRFAPEDEALRGTLVRAAAVGVPPGQISRLQGRLFQVLALACGARKILEIGALTGYSGLWLARGLTADGKLISLEANPLYAEMARATFAEAGLGERATVYIGSALELLPTLLPEAPFDLIFIDADKVNNPRYLEWALTLSRPGSLIIADNLVRNGRAFQTPPPDESSTGAAEYTRQILNHPRLVSVALTNDDLANGQDGFAISVVLA